MLEQWETLIQPFTTGLDLSSTDKPSLRPRRQTASATKRPEVDFMVRDGTRDLFGLELKTGKSHLSGPAPVAGGMRQFQLDTTDCDDITAVMVRESLPVYLLHVQVIDRAHPPTLEYVAIASWWTDVFRMADSFTTVAQRSRETRSAAYYRTSMFESLASFAQHINRGGPSEIANRIKRYGVPRLYGA